jgi:hypothetical protein
MEFKKTDFGVTVDYGLNVEEIQNTHRLWREIRETEEFLKWSWNDFKNHIGLDHDMQRHPRWKIGNKEKWLWAKLKYGL